MGFLRSLMPRSSVASSAVFATQLSRAPGLLSAFAGTIPALTPKYPTPASTSSVKIMPPRKLTIDFIALDIRSQQVIGWGRPKRMTDNKTPASTNILFGEGEDVQILGLRVALGPRDK